MFTLVRKCINMLYNIKYCKNSAIPDVDVDLEESGLL